jgi:hypothetical protein
MHEVVFKNTKPESEVELKSSLVVYNRDWQFPAITEQYAYEQLKFFQSHCSEAVYVAFPWATLIDILNTQGNQAATNLKASLNVLVASQNQKKMITVCQHIKMLKFQTLFNEAGITDVFWSHATKDQNTFPDFPHIRIHPFPLYPVQSANQRSIVGDRKYLFSFVGARSNQWYLTQSRSLIIDLLGSDTRGLVIGRDQWHYNKIVYDHQIKGVADKKEELVCKSATEEFQSILNDSIFSLCPSGTGPNSIRLWESIGYGSIPVILADTYLPPGDPALWQLAAVFCEETEEAIRALPDKLEELAKDTVLLEQKRHAMKQLWMLYGPDCFVYDIQKLFLSFASEANLPAPTYYPKALDMIAEKIVNNTALAENDADLFLTCFCSFLLLSTDECLARFKSFKPMRMAYIAAKGAASELIKMQLGRAIMVKNVDLWGE